MSFKIDKAAPTTTAKLDGAAPKANYDGPVAVDLDATDGTGSGVAKTEIRVDGGEWKPYAEEETILNSAADLAKWAQAGPGGLNWVDGGRRVLPPVRAGFGMPWYPVKDYGDFVIKLQWRDSSTGTSGNGGVVRALPGPGRGRDSPGGEPLPVPGRLGPERSRVGRDLLRSRDPDQRQPASEPQKTGSVYNFSSLNATQAKVQPRGTWVDYEIKVVGQTYTIIRNGEVLQTFENTPGKQSSRSGDPSTTDRQFTRGYVGLQNHSDADVIDYKNVRVLSLDAGSVRGPVTVTGTGRTRSSTARPTWRATWRRPRRSTSRSGPPAATTRRR